ncbi:flagellin [Amphibiibacter pelophylacis]|uniref:Flagellin n=1 Tax=Amphibiibacter pelophylacis TaxID=1799477 RepID=A0ACC6P2Y9_9BURK
MSGVNTNIMSMTSQRNLMTNSASLATTMNRLSSGLRVNSAKDDAAGLAIAERMNAQVKGMNVAQRNANDGISMAQTAEGGLSQIGSNMQRMRELAIQARNGTNSQADKDSLNSEYGQLREEITRVIANTKFNGKAVLGGDSNITFQVGAGTSASDKIDIAGVDLTQDPAMTAITAPGTGTAVNATDTAATVVGTLAGTLKATDGTTAATATSKWSELSRDSQSTLLQKLGYASNSSVNGASTVQGLVGEALQGKAINAATTQSTAATATVSQFDKGSAAYSLLLRIGTTAGSGISGDNNSIDAVVNALDTAIDKVNSTRATFGAAQSRMDAVISNLQVSSENQSAARSRIMDTNYAMETANLSRSQVLQQASQAMLAQANQAPQSVLQLLR